MKDNSVIDLRSDTVTKPTKEMLHAMAGAEVGDDIYREDPTVNKLEAEISSLLAKEAGLFLPSSTMANLIACLSHCRRGDEIIMGSESHLYYYEQGGSAAVANAHPRPLPNLPDGRIDLSAISAAIREAHNDHFPITRLIALENTHNRCGGRVLRPDYVDEVANLAKANRLSLHIDGARLWNAASFLGLSIARLSERADSVNVCFSKGLGAPAGAVLCGNRDFIAYARRMRKLLGGAMRQSGVLAAACLVGVEKIWPMLARDHEHARLFAKEMTKFPGVTLDASTVETNMFYFDLKANPETLDQFFAKTKELGVLISRTAEARFRIVCHHQISAEDIARAVAKFESIFLRLNELGTAPVPMNREAREPRL